MAETNVQALEKIVTEVDESQIKITFSNQCIKAQAFLVDKLKKQTKHQKEICNSISSGNVNLETEIKQAEQEIKNLLTAYETIKLGNIELRKEFLLKTSEKLEIIERIKTGEKKYEQLWLKCKSRFESIPFVQQYLQVENRNIKIEENIKKLVDEHETLLREFQIKKDEYQQLEQKLIIALVTFLVKERPKITNTIQDKIKEIRELNKEITLMEGKHPKSAYTKLRKPIEVQPSQQIESIPQNTCKINNIWTILSKNNNDVQLMPKLQLQGTDLDILSVKLEQIKKVDLYGEQPKESIMIDIFKSNREGSKISDECSSAYFKDINIPLDYDNKSKNYSDRKLIHILKDVKLENNETLEIMSKVDPHQLLNVEAIRSEITDIQNSENKVIQVLPMEDVHDGKKIAELLVPPSQFLDEKKSSQEKKVSFDISMEMTDFNETGNDRDSIKKNTEINETLNGSDDDLVSNQESKKIDDKMVKDSLDSSQLIYNEDSILHKMTQDKIVTSKFFYPNLDNNNQSSDFEDDNCKNSKINSDNTENMQITECKNNIFNECSDVNMDEIIPKASQNDEKVELPVTGFLFHHGSQGVPDSLNLSESTQGFEDAEGDFPHCIDSNILLSPKADITIENVDDNVQASSQDLPTFISGVRKSGLQFFGWTSSDSKEKSNVLNADSNFNFNFVGEEKKSRGGALFNIFR